MTATALKATPIELDRILECAVILNWHDLMQDAPGQVHIECTHAADRTVEFVKVWSSTLRGQWSLVCEYWMQPHVTLAAGITYRNGYSSQSLSWMLEMIMQHQGAFHSSYAPLAMDLIQVEAPSAAEIGAARLCMQAATTDVAPGSRG
jgi:hypothetical protein